MTIAMIRTYARRLCFSLHSQFRSYHRVGHFIFGSYFRQKNPNFLHQKIRETTIDERPKVLV